MKLFNNTYSLLLTACPAATQERTGAYYQLFKNGHRKLAGVQKEDGFVFVITAITVSIILGLSIVYLTNSVTLNITEASDVYSASQSYWTSISGIEYSLKKMSDGAPNISGTYTFFNSAIVIQLSDRDYSGSPLGSGQLRVVCTGLHGETKRILEVRYQVEEQDIWPDLSVIKQADGNNFDIKKNFTLNDSIYIGADVSVHNQAAIGDSPGDRTHIYVPTGKTVTGDFDANFSWSVHPNGIVDLPGFFHSEYDSLINIANAITGTSGNKYKGNYTINGGTFDLSGYENNTFFIKGKLTVKGATLTGGSLSSPGIIVVTKDIKLQKRSSTQSFVNDHIILIGDRKIDIKDHTQFGNDYSALAPALRPKTVNELFAKGQIEIKANAEVWAQIFTIDKIKVEGRVFGLIYSTTGIEFEKNSSFFEGALFVQKIKKPESKLKKGKMDLNHSFPLHYFSGIRYEVVPHSLREI